MRSVSNRVLFVSLVVMLISVACRKDIFSISGVDVDAHISMTLSGSRFGFNGNTLSSDAGYFTSYNHPEIVVKSDGGFEFNLYREMGTVDGTTATIYFYVSSDDLLFRLDQRYPLFANEESQARIEFLEYGQKRPLDGGGYISEGVIYSYKATDGYITFTDMERYGDDYLLDGEFSFVALGEGGDKIEVRNGRFSDCRVGLSYGE